MEDISLTYRNKFLRNQKSFNAKYRKLFDKVAADISQLVNDPNAKFSKSFNFNKPIEKKITAITSKFQEENLKLTEAEIAKSWELSNLKNDEIVKDYIKTISGLKTAERAALFIPNTSALEAFIARDRGAGKLADVIWKVAGQLRAEMEIHLGLGILNGDSANTISRRIRQYLSDPEALFRRVRDKNGKLVASQAMIDNAPGQGRYNSAYRNALRVARTETNMAYLAADHERWKTLDFVIGVNVRLSEQHPEYNFPEICEELEGDYPAEFKFVGWHPQCLCSATPILQPQTDFERSLAGEDVKVEPIKETPENFNQYMKQNYDRYMGYKSQPYFMIDNKKIIDKIIK